MTKEQKLQNLCIIWHKDNMQNLISALMITGFFIAVGILGWIDTNKAIKSYEKYLERNELGNG